MQKSEFSQMVLSAAIFFHTAAASVLHNIMIFINEELPVLPPDIMEPAFQGLLARTQIRVAPRGRQQEENQFELRNLVIGTFF